MTGRILPPPDTEERRRSLLAGLLLEFQRGGPVDRDLQLRDDLLEEAVILLLSITHDYRQDVLDGLALSANPMMGIESQRTTPDQHQQENSLENQHQQITGYRDLTQAEIDLMNEIKAKGEELGALCAKVKATPEVDQRWAAIAVTHLQQGTMALTRAVAKPTTF